jgi:glutamine synthetase
MILPAGISYAADLANALKSLSDVKNTGLTKLVNFTASLVDSLAESIEHLEETVKSNNPLMIIEQMKELRHYADQLEKVVPDNQWPLPSYADMFFI